MPFAWKFWRGFALGAMLAAAIGGLALLPKCEGPGPHPFTRAAAVTAASSPLTIIRVQSAGVAMETACSFVNYAQTPHGGTSAVVAWACQAPTEGLTFRPPPRGLRGPTELHVSLADAVWSFYCARVSVKFGFEDWTGCVHG